MSGHLSIVGIGPGDLRLVTPMARDAIEQADVIVGYKPYVKLIESLLTTQTIEANGMTREVERAQAAVEMAFAGKRVAVISSGDAGMYAMGSLVYQMLQEHGWHVDHPTRVNMIPGITAANACASLVGTPLGHDGCTISLSDLLTPWELIEQRIEAAAKADFAITFYNPRSRRRTNQIEIAQAILLQHRSPDTPVAIVDNAYRGDEQSVQISDLANFTNCEFAMTAAVVIGNSQSYLFADKIITPRGYDNKYCFESGAVKQGQQRGKTLNTQELSA
ncbi:precorrin-3B C(17)-methyltransferase [Ferrimonas lipolytica]|uniref:Precorrin-3B C(17)-methyltransferase n=1 Tax=Ferrimonas lipolytica TaxID=2724191 RepID=A0A6H1UB94_9GAMM|nr:precorrin-3B C(17)-methyltransferase [Ferrimonas lipolytica]QIZ76314.1 precorrin-3B C(17)-methyltransferase [Ferrimonas lipolytica]